MITIKVKDDCQEQSTSYVFHCTSIQPFSSPLVFVRVAGGFWSVSQLSATSPVYRRADISRQTTVHTHSHTHGQFRVTNLPDMHVFGRWQEAGVPGEKRSRHGENMHTPHRKAASRPDNSALIVH